MQTTPLSIIYNTILILVLFFAFSKIGFSQDAKVKQHYVINNAADAKEATSYSELLSNFDFDQYRFYDQRRTIKFIKSNITIELFSAKELLDTYGKTVSPFTIMDNIHSKEIAFIMNGGKAQIVTIKK